MFCSYFTVDIYSSDLAAATGNSTYLNNTLYFSATTCSGNTQIETFNSAGLNIPVSFCVDQDFPIQIYYYVNDSFTLANVSNYIDVGDCTSPTPTPTTTQTPTPDPTPDPHSGVTQTPTQTETPTPTPTMPDSSVTQTPTQTPTQTQTSTPSPTPTLGSWIMINTSGDVDISGMAFNTEITAAPPGFPSTPATTLTGNSELGTNTLTVKGVTTNLPYQFITVIDSNGASQQQALSPIPFGANVNFPNVFIDVNTPIQILVQEILPPTPTPTETPTQTGTAAVTPTPTETPTQTQTGTAARSQPETT